eukprot:2439672-Pyramimonas_sp.AAC.1
MPPERTPPPQAQMGGAPLRQRGGPQPARQARSKANLTGSTRERKGARKANPTAPRTRARSSAQPRWQTRQ